MSTFKKPFLIQILHNLNHPEQSVNSSAETLITEYQQLKASIVSIAYSARRNRLEDENASIEELKSWVTSIDAILEKVDQLQVSDARDQNVLSAFGSGLSNFIFEVEGLKSALTKWMDNFGIADDDFYFYQFMKLVRNQTPA